jgi:putative glutamine amidotransferase
MSDPHSSLIAHRSSPAPVVGITCYARGGDPLSFSLPVGYVDSVRAAGGMPVVLAPGEPDPAKLLDLVEGLVIAGGGDISPSAYGGRPHETVYQVCEERDRFEFDLARAALDAGRPLLFICRGLQVLNVCRGGTLHTHVPDAFGETVTHRMPPRLPTTHEVRVDPESRLFAVLGAERIEACSWHHQAVERLGEGLRAVAWADDGVVEAIEDPELSWCFAVQWHPEMQRDQEHARRLFAAFVAAARGSR